MGLLPHRRIEADQRHARHLTRQASYDQRTIGDRKRLLFSWLAALLIYVAVVLVSIILNWQFELEMGDKSGPLAVRIGNPEALDLPDVKPDTPPDTQPEDQPIAEPSSAPEEPQPVATSEARPQPTKAEPKPTPKPTIKPKNSPKPSPKSSAKPSQSPRPSASVGPATSLQPSAGPLADKVVAQTVPSKGHDNGNTYETSFFNVKGFVGRNGGTPISQYMPLPRQVLGALHDKIGHGTLRVPSAERQLEIFEKAYVQGGNSWQLRTENIPLPERDQLWNILEGSGYDVRKPEYKNRKLNPVVLEFTLGVPKDNKVEVKNIRVINSSGDGSIDDAVVFGFRAVASFSNGTKEEVKGRYTYSFE